MRSIKAKLKRPSGTSNGSKDDWSKLDQRMWHSVAANQPVKLATKFSKHPNVNVNKLCPSVGYSVVHYAAAKGLDDCLNVLLAHNANNSTRDVTGATPLHASARYGHKGTTSKLLATCTVNVNARDDNQCTALHFAAFEGHLDCVKLIASNKDCDIHCIDKDGRTALMVAAAMGRLSVCLELIKRGVDVNHRDSSSLHHTALSLAAEAGHADVVKLLCESGANYNYKLSDGRTALDVARGRSRRTVVDALHVIQLTEAAKKTDRNSRLTSTSSSSSNKIQPEKSEEKPKTERSEVRSPPEPVHHAPLEHTSLQRKFSPTNHDAKVEERASPSTHHNSPAMLPLYNDSKHGHLYDRDVSIYDSKSTLASVSSLDVSSILETNKSFHNETPPTPQLRSKDANAKHALKLAEELMLKEEQIAQMELRLHDLLSSSTREIESLKNSNVKYERSVQELEKANDLLSQDCMKLQLEKKDTVQHMEQLQESSHEIGDTKKELEISQEKLIDTEEICQQQTLKIEKLTRENHEVMGDYEREKAKLQSAQSGLNEILMEVGTANVDDDYNESLRLLKHEIQQLQQKNTQKNAKKAELEEKRKLEIEQLEIKVVEQDDIIQALKLKLVDSEREIQKVIHDRDFLVESRNLLQERLFNANEANSMHASTTSLLQEDLMRLKEQLTLESRNNVEKIQMEEKLRLSLALNEETAKKHVTDREKWQRAESDLKDRIKNLTHRYDEAKNEAVENEKVISQLRVERDEREALVEKLEKKLETLENERKEVEVEANRTRQHLTDSKQKCCQLEDEIFNLRKTKKDLATKLSSVKLYECTESERRKIDSMKLQLESLFQLIQDSEKKYNETISVYRGHLLMAAKGELDPDVLTSIREILKLRDERRPLEQL